MKPHKCPIQQVQYSEDGQLLAVVGLDQTVFFFEVRDKETHTPAGFVQVPAEMQNLAWHPDGSKIMLGLGDGTIVEINRPDLENISTEDTFNIQLDYRVF